MTTDDPDLPEAIARSLTSMADLEAALAEANACPVPVEHFKKAVRFVARMGPEQDVVKRAWAMTVIFAGKVDAAALLPMSRSIELRMQAMASLKDEPAFRAWSVRTSAEGPAAIEEVMGEIAADAPLVERAGRPSFDPSSFFEAVLAKSALGGTA